MDVSGLDVVTADTVSIERRSAPCEIRAAGRKLTGYAATFGAEARIGSMTEVIRAGAFSAAIGKGDILALVDHSPEKLLARTRTRSLRLSEDSKGLAFELDIPDTSVGRDVLALAERGDLGGMSFGFTIPKGGERWTGDKRELLNIDLREISVVSAWPAYDGTSVAARARMSESTRLKLARMFLETC